MEITDSMETTDSTATTQAFANRTLGRSGIEVSALGFGCWAIGGEWQDAEGQPLGWGKVDDEESVRAMQRALDLGVTFFDTADVYGTGHSERVLGRALGKHRTDVVIATKWGNLFDERTRIADGQDDSPEHVRRALTASLARLGTDYVDLYQLHLSDGGRRSWRGRTPRRMRGVGRRGAHPRLRLEHRRPGPRRPLRPGAALCRRTALPQRACRTRPKCSRSARSWSSPASTGARSPWGC